MHPRLEKLNECMRTYYVDYSWSKDKDKHVGHLKNAHVNWLEYSFSLVWDLLFQAFVANLISSL